MKIQQIDVKSFLIGLLCMVIIISMSYAQSNNAKLASIKIDLPNSDFKKAFGSGANIAYKVGLVSNRSTRFKTDSLTFTPVIDQFKTMVEIKLGETESLVNGQKLKHSAFKSEFIIKGYEQLTANVKNADFGTIKVNHKNGVIYSVTLLRDRQDYILFE